MTHKYQEQIDRLDWVIKNWVLIKRNPTKARSYYKKKWYGYNLNLRFGLCYNCNFCSFENDEYFEMFQSFKKFSGSMCFPLGNFENYNLKTNFANTPERLELAIHCKGYLENLNV